MYSTTQTSNYFALAGLIVLTLSHFNVVVTQDSVIAVIAGLVSLYGIIRSIVNRYQKGDITIAGKFL